MHILAAISFSILTLFLVASSSFISKTKGGRKGSGGTDIHMKPWNMAEEVNSKEIKLALGESKLKLIAVLELNKINCKFQNE